jgi:hypothetical protein
VRLLLAFGANLFDAPGEFFGILTCLMFSSTEASTFQWESSVFVSPIKAPALMILDEYEAEFRGRFPSPVRLADMDLAHRLPEFKFEGLPVFLDHFHQERRYGCTTAPRPGSLEGYPVEEFPKVGRKMNTGSLVRTLLRSRHH